MDIIDKLKQDETKPIVIANQQGLIEYANALFTAVWGWSMEEMRDKPLSMIIPVHLRDAHHLGFSRFLLTGEPTLLNKPLHLVILKKNGEIVPAEHVIYASKSSGSWKFAATICPLT